jgi:hypothetical protein
MATFCRKIIGLKSSSICLKWQINPEMLIKKLYWTLGRTGKEKDSFYLPAFSASSLR